MGPKKIYMQGRERSKPQRQIRIRESLIYLEGGPGQEKETPAGERQKPDALGDLSDGVLGLGKSSLKR